MVGELGSGRRSPKDHRRERFVRRRVLVERGRRVVAGTFSGVVLDGAFAHVARVLRRVSGVCRFAQIAAIEVLAKLAKLAVALVLEVARRRPRSRRAMSLEVRALRLRGRVVGAGVDLRSVGEVLVFVGRIVGSVVQGRAAVTVGGSGGIS